MIGLSYIVCVYVLFSSSVGRFVVKLVSLRLKVCLIEYNWRKGA